MKFSYSYVETPDAVTARLRRHADVWRDISNLNNQAAADLIRQDKIDVLIDLTMHLLGSRILIFARKPAPVQVSWLAYPGTTGVEAIDYRITDPRLDPVDSRESDFSTQEPYYSERSVRLADTYWCYDPYGMETNPEAELPGPSPLPFLTTGNITFGCLNNFCKINEQTLALWAKVMAAVPNSRLILLAPPGSPRDWVLKSLGVTQGDRVEFLLIQPRRQYLQTYRRIDLCLDTIHCNGHTTTLDALWMGVPVVTRVGTTIAGRAGWSQMHNVGMMELVAWTDEQFVKSAVDLAGDVGRLTALRATLRERMERSPLMDAARFTRNMERAYRQMWQAWCRGAAATTAH